MSWDSLIMGADKTIMETFGEQALVDDSIQCRAIIDVISRTSGSVYEPIVENQSVAIFLRSEIEDEDGEGFDIGMRIDMSSGESYEIEAACEDKTNKNYIAYWVKKVDS